MLFIGNDEDSGFSVFLLSRPKGVFQDGRKGLKAILQLQQGEAASFYGYLKFQQTSLSVFNQGKWFPGLRKFRLFSP
jgi:hypothetical protein